MGELKTYRSKMTALIMFLKVEWNVKGREKSRALALPAGGRPAQVGCRTGARRCRAAPEPRRRPPLHLRDLPSYPYTARPPVDEQKTGNGLPGGGKSRPTSTTSTTIPPLPSSSPPHCTSDLRMSPSRRRPNIRPPPPRALGLRYIVLQPRGRRTASSRVLQSTTPRAIE